MALPFQPETTAQAAARIGAALEPLIDGESVQIGAQSRPGLFRRHVFDFEDGLRLIISRDDLGSGPQLHVTASIQPQTRLWKRCYAELMTGEHANRIAAARFEVISGMTMPPFKQLSAGGIPHFWGPMPERVGA